jgi:hypothetical protein
MDQDFRLNGVKLRRMPYISCPKGTNRGAGQQARPGQPAGGQRMFRLIKVILVLAVIGLAGLSAYAYLGLKPPAAQETRLPVTLNVD